jgi:hypothetical protein
MGAQNSIESLFLNTPTEAHACNPSLFQMDVRFTTIFQNTARSLSIYGVSAEII